MQRMCASRDHVSFGSIRNVTALMRSEKIINVLKKLIII